MTLRDALEIVVPHLGDRICIHSNGYMSRAAFGVRDTATCFYMIGSMGLASSIGLGLALARPERRVVVFEGDGNVLMNLGTLARVASAAPANFVQLCFDNRAHASTGAQPTISGAVRLDAIARAAGYRHVARIESATALEREIPALLAEPGPTFALVPIDLGPDGPPGPRITHTPPEMTARLRRALGVAS